LPLVLARHRYIHRFLRVRSYGHLNRNDARLQSWSHVHRDFPHFRVYDPLSGICNPIFSDRENMSQNLTIAPVGIWTDSFIPKLGQKAYQCHRHWYAARL